MAQRFGGQHSPDAAGRAAAPGGTGRGETFSGARPSRAGARVNFLFLAAAPLLVMGFWKPPAGLALAVLAYAVIAAAAFLTREGLKAEDAYEARNVARRPALPRKMLGAGLMAVGIGLGAFASDHGLAGMIILAILGGVLHLGAFGIDPLKDKLADGVDGFQTERVARVVTDAEALLTQMRDQARRMNDRHVLARVDAFQEQVRALIRTVENDPRRLTAARRYLGVYLQGARDATTKFAELFLRNRETQTRADYESLLDDLSTSFGNQTRALLDDDRTALDIEMDVLRQRLEREGVRPE